MNMPPLPAWTAIADEARFSEPGDCTARADRFGRRVKRRNVFEYVAGGFVACLFAGGAVAGAIAGDVLFAVILASFVPAVGFVLWYLRRHGSYDEPRPEQPCRDHLRRSLTRQRDLLAMAWLWYVAPFLPGSLALFGYVAWRVSQKAGWAVAIEGLLWPAAITFGIFGGVALLNVWGARALSRDIAALDDAD